MLPPPVCCCRMRLRQAASAIWMWSHPHPPRPAPPTSVAKGSSRAAVWEHCCLAARLARRGRGGAAAAAAWVPTLMPLALHPAAAAGQGCGGARGGSSGGRSRSGWGAPAGGRSGSVQSSWTWHLTLPTAGGSGGCATLRLAPAPSLRQTAIQRGRAAVGARAAAHPGEAPAAARHGPAAAGAAGGAAATTTWPTCCAGSSRSELRAAGCRPPAHAGLTEAALLRCGSCSAPCSIVHLPLHSPLHAPLHALRPLPKPCGRRRSAATRASASWCSPRSSHPGTAGR